MLSLLLTRSNACLDHSLFVLLVQLANVPYDSFGAGESFGFFKLQTEFDQANFDRSRWDGGIAAIFYGWIAMAAAAYASMSFVRDRGLGPVANVVVVALGAPLSALLWAPFHIAKEAACFAAPSVAPTRSWQGHLRCIRESPAGDDVIWIFTLVALLTTLVASAAAGGAAPRNGEPDAKPGESPILKSPIAGPYFLFLAVL